MAHNLNIKDQNQPLILVRRKVNQGEHINFYFIPEFCYFCELGTNAIKDRYFMKELSKYTKIEPIDRVKKANEFLNIFSDKERDP